MTITLDEINHKQIIDFTHYKKESYFYTLLFKCKVTNKTKEIEVATNHLPSVIKNMEMKYGNDFFITDVSDSEPVDESVSKNHRFRF